MNASTPSPRDTRPARAAIPLALLLGLSFASLGCDAPALRANSEAEANAALTVLFEVGLDPEKISARDGFEIRVPNGELRRAVRALDEAGLPRRSPAGWEATFEQGGLVPSRVEERVRLVQGAAGEITRTLLTLPGVVDARVHLAAADLGSSARDSQPTVEKASVLLRVRPSHRPTEAETNAVRALVAGAVAGLEPVRVEVVVVQNPEGTREPRAAAP